MPCNVIAQPSKSIEGSTQPRMSDDAVGVSLAIVRLLSLSQSNDDMSERCVASSSGTTVAAQHTLWKASTGCGHRPALSVVRQAESSESPGNAQLRCSDKLYFSL